VERARGRGLVVTSVVLERQQLGRLDAIAARERRSRSFLVRDAIEHEIDRYEQSATEGPER
jgi:predicted transcriptional regulator